MALTIQEVAVTCNQADSLAALDALRPMLAGIGWEVAAVEGTQARFVSPPRVCANRTSALELALRLSRAGVPVAGVEIR